MGAAGTAHVGHEPHHEHRRPTTGYGRRTSLLGLVAAIVVVAIVVVVYLAFFHK